MNGAKLKLESMIKLPLKKVSVLIDCTHVTFIKKIDVSNKAHFLAILIIVRWVGG